MGLSINSNGGVIFAQRQAGAAANRIGKGLQQLASGLRINQAADDAAGLAIAEKFRASVRQLNQEVNNLQTGMNMAQTAEGGLSVQGEIAGRVRELAVQAANGTLTDDQRAAINAEAQQLLEEFDDIGQNTEFNGQATLDGTAGTVTLDAEGDVELEFNESTTASRGLDNVDLSTQAGAEAALAAVDAAAGQINQDRAALGAQQNRVTAAIATREVQAQNEAAAESVIRDLDVARAVVEQTRNQILLQGGISAILQGNIQSQTAARLLGG